MVAPRIERERPATITQLVRQFGELEREHSRISDQIRRSDYGLAAQRPNLVEGCIDRQNGPSDRLDVARSLFPEECVFQALSWLRGTRHAQVHSLLMSLELRRQEISCEMALLTTEILDQSPLSLVEAALKIRFLSACLLLGQNAEKDLFILAIEDCAEQIERFSGLGIKSSPEGEAEYHCSQGAFAPARGVA